MLWLALLTVLLTGHLPRMVACPAGWTAQQAGLGGVACERTACLTDCHLGDADGIDMAPRVRHEIVWVPMDCRAEVERAVIGADGVARCTRVRYDEEGIAWVIYR